MIITDKSVSDALMWCAENVEAAAEARAQKVFMEESRKVKKAHLMKECNEDGEWRKEMFAYSHPEYETLVNELKTAIYNDALHTFKRANADMVIEAWRTQQANIRAAERVT